MDSGKSFAESRRNGCRGESASGSPPLSIVIDASVPIVAFVDGPRSDAASRLLVRERHISAPSVIVAEMMNGLWNIGRKRPDQLARSQAYVYDELSQRIELYEDSSLIADAAALAWEFDHPVYDCLYLALAARLGQTLYTFDERLRRRIASSRFGSVVVVPA